VSLAGQRTERGDGGVRQVAADRAHLKAGEAAAVRLTTRHARLAQRTREPERGRGVPNLIEVSSRWVPRSSPLVLAAPAARRHPVLDQHPLTGAPAASEPAQSAERRLDRACCCEHDDAGDARWLGTHPVLGTIVQERPSTEESAVEDDQ